MSSALDFFFGNFPRLQHDNPKTLCMSIFEKAEPKCLVFPALSGKYNVRYHSDNHTHRHSENPPPLQRKVTVTFYRGCKMMIALTK